MVETSYLEHSKSFPATSRSDYGGFWLRFVAHIIDCFIAPVCAVPIAIVGCIPLVIVAAIYTNGAPEWLRLPLMIYMSIWVVLLCLSSLIYHAWFESSQLQATPGKICVGLIVTDADGERLTFMRSLWRNTAKIFSYLTGYVGYLLAGFTPQKQALHDMVSMSLVVRKPIDTTR